MYKIGEIIKTKKPHVCQSKNWEVLRVGADIKLKCCGCERIIMMSKIELDKKVIKENK